MKITPLKSNGEESSIPITELTAQSSDTTKATVSVTQGNKLSVKFKKRGTVDLTVTAINSNAGISKTSVLTFNVVDASDVFEVVSSVDSYLNDSGTLIIEGYMLESVSFRVKDAFKNYVTVEIDSNSSVTSNESNGVYTITSAVVDMASVNFRAKVGIREFVVGFVSLKEFDTNVNYEVTSADMQLVTYYGVPAYGDGDTCELSLAEWANSNVVARFGINPSAFRDAPNIITTVVSSDDSIVSVRSGEPFLLNNNRSYDVDVNAVGTATLTLHITDGVEYDETATINIVVIE